MDPASIAGLISFAGDCAGVLGKVVKTLHQAPNEILSLHNELSDLRLVLMEYNDLSNSTASKDGALSSLQNEYKNCVQRAHTTLDELARLNAQLFNEKQGHRHFDRYAWLRKKSTAIRLQKDLTTTRQNLRDLMSLSQDSKLSKIEIRLDSLDGLLSQMAPINATAGESTPYLRR